jgi:uncharacterized membrane-anchored protein YitT (DUF2179 family)
MNNVKRVERFVHPEVMNLLQIIAGSTLLALGVVVFLVPNRIATGGTPGMAILLHYLTGLSTGTLMILINLPLLIMGVKYLGKIFAIRTVLAIALSSAMVDFFALVLKLQPVSHNTLLATVFGGIAIGVGVGLVLRGNASAGGSTIIARIVSSKTRIKPGQVILAIDLLIIISAGLLFKEIERALWSLISIYVTSKLIDMILTGGPTEKVVHIVSDKVEQLSEQIIQHLGEHGTILQGSGLYKDQQKTMIFIVVEVRNLGILRNLVQRHDPDAFLIVMEASEMMGRGH